jgi:polyhydroxyalkanoate synthesis regulator phasin
MTVDRGLLDRLKARGEEVVTQLSGELMSNPRFVKAVEGAMRGKEKIEEAAGQALRRMNLPARGELRRAVARIEVLEREVAALKARRKPARPRARKAASSPARRRTPTR